MKELSRVKGEKVSASALVVFGGIEMKGWPLFTDGSKKLKLEGDIMTTSLQRTSTPALQRGKRSHKREGPTNKNCLTKPWPGSRKGEIGYLPDDSKGIIKLGKKGRKKKMKFSLEERVMCP